MRATQEDMMATWWIRYKVSGGTGDMTCEHLFRRI